MPLKPCCFFKQRHWKQCQASSSCNTSQFPSVHVHEAFINQMSRVQPAFWNSRFFSALVGDDSMHERDLKCANSTYFEKVERKEEKTWTYARRLLQLLRDNDPSLTTLDLTTDVVGDLLPPSGRFAGSELEGALVHNTAVTGMSIDDLSRSCERSSGPQASLHALKALRGCALPLSLKVRNWEAVRCLVDALGDEEPQGGRAAEHGGVAMHEIMVFKLDVASIGIELGPEGLEALLSLRMAALTEHLRTGHCLQPHGRGFRAIYHSFSGAQPAANRPFSRPRAVPVGRRLRGRDEPRQALGVLHGVSWQAGRSIGRAHAGACARRQGPSSEV